MDNNDLIKKIKEFFEEENLNQNNNVTKFSNDVIASAYQKITDNLTDMITTEEDPMVIGELLKNYLEVTKMVDEKGLAKQQLLLKLFEQLNKYEQNRYY